MNLVVEVEGRARSIAGVTTSTTTTQIVHVLAQAINQRGMFILIAKFADSVRLSISPHIR